MLNRALICKPLRLVDGIHDFLGETVNNDLYFVDLERVAQEEKDGIIREAVRPATDAIRNCLEFGLLRLIKSNWRVLDVGSGDGFLLKHIPVSPDKKIACDCSFVKLKQIQEPCLRIRADAEMLPLRSNYFDLILCTEVLEHVRNDLRVIGELYRLLKNQGLLVFSEPWEQDLSVLTSPEYVAKYGSYPSRHCRTLNDARVHEYFDGKFDILSHTSIDIGRRFMEFKPYSIKLMLCRKR
jgi:2-polyprenyl-3-methyl-5-hydroxy-6-metoxy-1,4-benzoquinol methylase